MTRGFTHETSVSKSVEWFTPEWIFKALDVTFELDPCSPGKGLSHVPAKNIFTIADDGLTQPWAGRVWLNPPYGRGIEKWLGKAADLASSGAGSVIALVPNRTDTKWFQQAAEYADAILFPASRIKFHPGDKDAPFAGSPGTGSAFFGFGSWAARTLRDSKIQGFITTPRNGYFIVKDSVNLKRSTNYDI